LRTFIFIPSDISFLSRKASETALADIPSSLAMSLIVTDFFFHFFPLGQTTQNIIPQKRNLTIFFSYYSVILQAALTFFGSAIIRSQCVFSVENHAEYRKDSEKQS
jgi:hypothetical protein